MLHAIAPVRTQSPGVLPVLLAEAKAHLCVEHSDDDGMITGLIAAVTDHFDGWGGILGRCLIEQTWSARFPGFPCDGVLRFPLAPLAGTPAVAITYFDTSSALQTLSTSLYRIATDAIGPCAVLASGSSWPATAERPDAVTFSATVGYGAAPADVPAALRVAILMQVGDLYANRETTISNRLVLNPTVARLISPYCRVS